MLPHLAKLVSFTVKHHELPVFGHLKINKKLYEDSYNLFF